MKIRTDYVSNSSSSSFIIGNSDFIEHFNIKKNDIVDAFKAMMPKENFKHCSIYDMTNKKDIKRLDNLDILKGFTCNLSYVEYKTGNLVRWNRNYEQWEKFVESFSDAFDLIIHGAHDVDETKIRVPKYDKKGIFQYCEHKPAPKWMIDVIRKMKERLGVLSNWEVAHRPESKFVVHFDENEICDIDGFCTYGKHEDLETPFGTHKGLTKYQKEINKEIKNSIYETDSHSMHRICELLANYWIKNGRINPDDDFFKDSENTNSPLSDFYESIISYCLHEG